MTKKQVLSLAGVFILGCCLLLTASLAKKHRKAVEWDGTPYNIEKVNSFDSEMAQPYNETFDKLGDVGVMAAGGLVALAVIVAFFASLSKGILKAFKVALIDSIYFGISGMYANSLYRILKTIVGRIRPYMYFPNSSEKGIAEGDFFRSWPSGHSANVFIAFGFLLTWFTVRYEESKFKKPLLSLIMLVCCATMFLRLISGNHFFTDVISGAALGFLVSYGISNLCYKIYGKEVNEI